MVDFVIIKTGTLIPAPGKKVLKASDYALLVEAWEVLEQTRREAEHLMERARQRYEEEKKRGYEEGLLEGKRKITEKMLETVQKTVDYLAASEETLCSLVTDAVRKIVGEMDEQELIVRTVRKALVAVQHQKHVKVKVSPSDIEYVQSQVEALSKEFRGIGFLEIVPDPNLDPRCCVVESEMGVVDASVEVQLRAIENALKKYIRPMNRDDVQVG